MAKAPGKPKSARKRSKGDVTDGSSSGKVTYRELRNTPAKVWERLARDQPLTLMAGGEAKALLIPIPDGDPEAAHEAYLRGRALLAVRRIQDAARRGGKSAMTLQEINRVIREARRELRERDSSSD